MNAQSAVTGLLRQLDEMLQQLSSEQYCHPLAVLSGATIGQHCRHVIECFQEMDKGYEAGIINYDGRRRNLLLETDPQYARRRITDLENNLDRPDIPLLLCAGIGDDITLRLSSSYYRELYHNIDHAVHHMALIRAGMPAFPHVRLPDSFGVAWATLKFRSASIVQNFN